MRRKFLNRCAMLSLILCAAAVWWWIGRSPASVDQVSFQPNSNQSVRLWASNGKVMFTKTVRNSTETSDLNQLSWGTVIPDPADKTLEPPKTPWTGFGYATEAIASKAASGMQSTVVVPAWMLVGLFGLLPLMRVATIMKRYRIAVAVS